MFLNKYVKALLFIWFIISLTIASFVASDSISNGVRLIFLFLGVFIVFSAPSWIYLVGFYLWGDGYIRKTLFKILKTLTNMLGSIKKINCYQVGGNNLGRNFISNLFKGNVRLVITYWLFFKGMDLLNSAIIEFYKFNSKITYDTFIAYSIIYFIFSLFVTWRSAENYNGKSHWKKLAKFIVVLSFVAFLASLLKSFSYTQDADLIVKEIESINKTLPTMVDDVTRFDSVRLENQKDIIYSYTIILKDYFDNNLQKNDFTQLMKPSLVKNLCSDKGLLEISNKRNMVYEYNIDGSVFAKIMVSQKDCDL